MIRMLARRDRTLSEKQYFELLSDLCDLDPSLAHELRERIESYRLLGYSTATAQAELLRYLNRGITR